MKRILALFWVPTLLASEPVTLQKIKQQMAVVDRVTQRLVANTQQRQQLIEKINGQELFLREFRGQPEELGINIKDLETIHRQDQKTLTNLEKKASDITQELERETWFLTGLDMLHFKEQLAGIPQQLHEREARAAEREKEKQNLLLQQQPDHNKYNNSSEGSDSDEEQALQLLQHAKRGGGPDDIKNTLERLTDLIGKVEQEAYEAAQTLTTAGDVPTSQALSDLADIREKAEQLKHDMGKLIAEHYPKKEDRAAVIATLHAKPAYVSRPTTNGENPSAPLTEQKRTIMVDQTPEANNNNHA